MPQQRPTPGAKRWQKRRKGRYIKGYSHWMGVHKETQALANRSARRFSNGEANTFVTVSFAKRLPTEDSKRRVASNRCGNGCGRRAAMDDYLCWTCRNMHP